MQDELRKLPSVDKLINVPGVSGLIDDYGRALVIQGTRIVLDDLRRSIIHSGISAPDERAIATEIEEWLSNRMSNTLRPVINATGVIIHTNLGRAPLSDSALEDADLVSKGYSNLEFDLESGVRGSRSVHAQSLLIELTGAESALVVNNNAAAVFLMLAVLCKGREVIISRGQLIEIGGGFRLPDVMEESGARLVEVGTTNRTHLKDYVDAIGEDTAAILVAHRSNFKIVGFTAEPDLDELATAAHENGLILLYDQGSGALRDTGEFGLDSVLTVSESLELGVDIVAFSGDKLLGGPQAGIICGREDLISRLKRHPLARAMRADKLCLAALSATLQSQMISQPIEMIGSRAQRWISALNESGISAYVIDGRSMVGGGSLPGTSLPTKLVAVSSEKPDVLAAKLRSSEIPIISRIGEGKLLFDPRTVVPEQDEELLREVVKSITQYGL
jgi:L-seryl-tRNA(Ser) seleniumtransferase